MCLLNFMKLKKLLCITTFCFVCLTAGCSSNHEKDNIISSYETERENSNSESSDATNRQNTDSSEKDDSNQEDNKQENTSKKDDSTDNQQNNLNKDNSNQEDNNLKKDNSMDNQENSNSENNNTDNGQKNSNSENNNTGNSQENSNLENNNTDNNQENSNLENNNTDNNQEVAESPQPNTNANEEDNGFYETSTSRTSSEVESFAETIKSLVLAKDWTGLSNLIAYPISIDGAFYNDSAAFLSIDFENNLNPDFISSLEAETCHEMFNNWQGISMGANGEIWFKDVYSDESNSTLQITAINGMIN
ncbi:MAG: hypothetical protein K1V96_04035 [Lachnospiraceae bacterium]